MKTVILGLRKTETTKKYEVSTLENSSKVILSTDLMVNVVDFIRKELKPLDFTLYSDRIELQVPNWFTFPNPEQKESIQWIH